MGTKGTSQLGHPWHVMWAHTYSGCWAESSSEPPVLYPQGLGPGLTYGKDLETREKPRNQMWREIMWLTAGIHEVPYEVKD